MHEAKLLNTLLKTAAERVFPAFLPRRIEFVLAGELPLCWLQGTEPKAC